MAAGYVYILSNELMPGLLKIGLTRRSPEERARELSSSTGIPIDFQVEYEVYAPNAKLLERTMHTRLDRYRVNHKREFFKLGMTEAISLLSMLAYEQILNHNSYSHGIDETFNSYEAIEILKNLKEMYPNMIKDEIISIRIYQTRLRCYLELTEENRLYEDREVPLVDQKIHRIDLGFIIDDGDFDELLFDPKESVQSNARIFLNEFDAYSKLVCCSELFNDFGSDNIQSEHFKRNA
ncbi:TPA: GIY-YIG nuclease family protein [Vibrio vulnificus]|nr:GIY-YIG nuclease family protein [Vibrio vulnificus]